MQHLTSTGVRWLVSHAAELKAHNSVLMLADMNPLVLAALKRSGALDVMGAGNMAWEAAQQWLKAHE